METTFHTLTHPKERSNFIQDVSEDEHLLDAVEPAVFGDASSQLHESLGNEGGHWQAATEVLQHIVPCMAVVVVEEEEKEEGEEGEEKQNNKEV